LFAGSQTRLSKGDLSFSIADITTTFKLVISKKEVNDDYKKDVYAVIGTLSEIGANN
jgi:hypothetical protein